MQQLVRLMSELVKASCGRRSLTNRSDLLCAGDVSTQVLSKAAIESRAALDPGACQSTDASGPERAAKNVDGSDTDNTERSGATAATSMLGFHSESINGPARSVDSSGCSSDGYDTDDTDLMPNSEPSLGGSDVETTATEDSGPRRLSDSAAQDFRFCSGKPAASLNPKAAIFVPSPARQEVGRAGVPHLRESIRSVIQALEDWESSTAAEDSDEYTQDENVPSETVQNRTVQVVNNALSHLAPQDAAMIKLFLDAKLASQTVSSDHPRVSAND